MPQKKIMPHIDTPSLRTMLGGVYQPPDGCTAGVLVLNHRDGCPVQTLFGDLRMPARVTSGGTRAAAAGGKVKYQTSQISGSHCKMAARAPSGSTPKRFRPRLAHANHPEAKRPMAWPLSPANTSPACPQPGHHPKNNINVQCGSAHHTLGT